MAVVAVAHERIPEPKCVADCASRIGLARELGQAAFEPLAHRLQQSPGPRLSHSSPLIGWATADLTLNPVQLTDPPDRLLGYWRSVYEIDGNRFSTLEEFYDQVTRALDLSSHCGGSLDAFDEVLQGGFGTPKDPTRASQFDGRIMSCQGSGSATRRLFVSSNCGWSALPSYGPGFNLKRFGVRLRQMTTGYLK